MGILSGLYPWMLRVIDKSQALRTGGKQHILQGLDFGHTNILDACPVVVGVVVAHGVAELYGMATRREVVAFFWPAVVVSNDFPFLAINDDFQVVAASVV